MSMHISSMQTKCQQSVMSLLLLLLLLLLTISVDGRTEASSSSSSSSGGGSGACPLCTAMGHNANANDIPSRLQRYIRARRHIDVTTTMSDEAATTTTTTTAAAAAAMNFQRLNGEYGDGNQLLNEIPLDFFRELDNITTDYEEFLAHYPNKIDDDEVLGSALQREARKNFKRSVERASSIIPKGAPCQPENEIVSLVPADAVNDPNVIYVPTCTRVKRCSGCCTAHPALYCKPTETETINFQVIEFKFAERNARVKRLVPIEQHLNCVCGCRVVAGDCNAYQLYDEKNCRCDCTNVEEKRKCNDMEHKIWDERECRCVCRDNHTCTTGTFFDEGLCKCVTPDVAIASTYFRPDISLDDRKRFIIDATPIDTDNRTLYDV